MNRFFNIDDKRIEELEGFKLPKEWWSRPYEYAFAMDFVNKDDVCLDIGCGLEHPFKNYLGKNCKKTIALDIDRRVSDLKSTGVEFVIDDILNYNPDFKFDKIYAISTIEHTLQYLEEKFENIKNMLKDDGKIILTVDYPTLRPEKLLECAKKSNLALISDFNEEMAENVLYHSAYNLNVYGMILTHEKNMQVENRKTKIEKDYKIK